MSRCVAVLLVAATLAVLAGPVIAAEGRTPVFLGGTVIAADGRYILTRNISSVGAGIPVITIGASKVDLDLNGFTIFGAGGAAAILIAGPVVEVRIHDGTIIDGDYGVDRPLGPPGRLVILEDLKILDSGFAGVHLGDVENVAIRRNTIFDPGMEGILIDPPGLFRHGEIVNNSIKRTGDDGIAVFSGAAMEISHNQIEVAGSGAIGLGTGISLTDSVGCLLKENVISDASDHGILLTGASSGNKVYDNVIRHAFINGILLISGADNNLLLNNVVTDCGFDAGGADGLLVMSSGNHIEGNTLNANSGCGLHFALTAGLNVFGRNVARGNGLVPGACPGAALCAPLFTPDSCDEGGLNDTSLENMIPGPPPF